MSKVLTTTAAITMLRIAAMGSAPALAANYHDYHPWSRPNAMLVTHQPGHAGPVSFHAHPVRAKRGTR